jgi:uncharacterized protein (DUF1810 family)
VSDSFDLQRFVDAQVSIYRQVVEELSHGRKQTHWMWFIFPQIAGSARWLNASRSARTPRPSLTSSMTCSGLAWSNARASS